MSVPYDRTNADRRGAVTDFFGALMGNPIAQGVVSPQLGIMNTLAALAQKAPVSVDMSTGPGPISRQQAQRRGLVPASSPSMFQAIAAQMQQPQSQKNPNTSLHSRMVQGNAKMEDAMARQGSTPDPVQMGQMTPEVAQQIKQRQSGQGNIFQNIGTALQGNPQTGKPGFTGGSFSNMAQQAAQMQADGQELPFQELSGKNSEEIRQSFNRGSPGQGTTRSTNWDTDKAYQVVNKLSSEDYRELESLPDRESLVDLSSDTTINLLEDSGINMSQGLEARFKAGIDMAMQDWYETQVAEGGGTSMTDYLMGMTQVALALIENSNEGVALSMDEVAPVAASVPTAGDQPAASQNFAQTSTGMIAQTDPVSEEQLLMTQGQGQVAPEFITGFMAALAENDQLTLAEYMQGGR